MEVDGFFGWDGVLMARFSGIGVGCGYWSTRMAVLFYGFGETLWGVRLGNICKYQIAFA